MDIKKHTGLELAEGVISLVEPIIKNINRSGSIGVESFDNCREQGLVLVLYGIPSLYLAVCNDRHSEEIKVYSYNETSHPSNLPSAGGWGESICFSKNSPDLAAEYIVKQLKKHTNIL